MELDENLPDTVLQDEDTLNSQNVLAKLLKICLLQTCHNHWTVYETVLLSRPNIIIDFFNTAQ